MVFHSDFIAIVQNSGSSKVFVASTVAAVMLSALPAAAADKKVQQLELFGISLKNAEREQLRQAFKQNGLHPTREDKNY